MNRVTRLAIWTVDLAAVACVAVWLSGGIPWDGRILLKHGADPRRAAMILIATAFLALPGFRERSWMIGILRGAWGALLRPKYRIWLWCITLFWAASLGVLQAMALRFPLYDVGLFHQILDSIASGRGFQSSISGAGDFFRDHFSPSLALLSPVFWLSGHSEFSLPVLHAVLIFAGIAAWMDAARFVPGLSREEGESLSVAALLFGLGFDSLWGNLRWGFHETAISFAAFSWCFALALRGAARDSLASKLFALALLVIGAGAKETSLLTGALIALCLGLCERKSLPRILHLVLFPLLLAVFFWFERQPHAEGKNYFLRYYSYLGGSLSEAIQHLPGRLLQVSRVVGWGELLSYVKTVFWPFLFLPFLVAFSRRLERDGLYWLKRYGLLIAAPAFVCAALATYPALRRSGFHYVLELWPVGVILTLLGAGHLRRQSREWFQVFVASWLVFQWLSLDQDPWNQMRDYGRDAANARPVVEALQAIPRASAVLADEMTGVWLAGRRDIARWPDAIHLGSRCPEWVVLGPGRAETSDILGAVSPVCPLGTSLESIDRISGWRIVRLKAAGS